MPTVISKPRSAYVGALPYTDAIQQQIVDAANAGAATGTLTAQLRNLGYTMADISQLYNQASSTATLTPQIIQYLQAENGYMQQQLQDQNKTWMYLGLLALGLYFITTPARRRD